MTKVNDPGAAVGRPGVQVHRLAAQPATNMIRSVATATVAVRLRPLDERVATQSIGSGFRLAQPSGAG
jgi:hypothetical protein